MKRFYAGLIVLILLIIVAHSVSAAPYAYITQVLDGTVTVYDTVKNKKVTTIDVGGAPWAVAMSPDGTKAYITCENYPAGWISVVDVFTHAVDATIPVGPYPLGMAMLPNGTKLYVRDQGIKVIDTATQTVDATIPHPAYTLAAHPDGSKVYVTDYDGGALLVIDTSSQVISQTINVGTWVAGVAVHPDGRELYVANDDGPDEDGQNVVIIDTSTFTVTGTISLSGDPDQIAFNPAGTRAYVTSWGSSVYVIDTTSRAVIATIDVGPTDGGGVDVSPDGAFVYVATNYLDDMKDKRVNDGVKVIDAATNTVKKKIKLPGEPISLGKFIGGPQFHMTVQTAGSGSGKVISKKLTDIDCGNGGSKCEADFYVNRKVQLQAIAADGFVFTGWSGGACTKKSKTCKLVITDDYSVTATFEPK